MPKNKNTKVKYLDYSSKCWNHDGNDHHSNFPIHNNYFPIIELSFVSII